MCLNWTENKLVSLTQKNIDNRQLKKKKTTPVRFKVQLNYSIKNENRENLTGV